MSHIAPLATVGRTHHDRVGGKGEEDLERHYRTALTILFRGCS